MIRTVHMETGTPRNIEGHEDRIAVLVKVRDNLRGATANRPTPLLDAAIDWHRAELEKAWNFVETA